VKSRNVKKKRKEKTEIGVHLREKYFTMVLRLQWRRSRAKSSGREYERIRTLKWVLFLLGLGHRTNTNISVVVTDPVVQLRFQEMLHKIRY